MREFAELLSQDQAQQVHEASLEILENVGVMVHNLEARERFARHGCLCDAGSKVVRFPHTVVEEHLASCPPSFTFHGRDTRYDRTIPRDRPLMATASSAPDVVDLGTGKVRRAQSADIARIAYLVNELQGYDIFGISVTADDAPPGQFHLSRFYPALKHCLKPVRGSAPSLAEMERILEMCFIVAGSQGAFWERPFVTFIYCPVVSPLTMDVDSTELLMRFAERGIPSYGVPAPTAGLTAPLSLLGALTVCNTEFLAQTTLEQMSRPGKPAMYDAVLTVADVRTGAYAPGAIETGIMAMGCAQMARLYNVPSGGFAGLTNSKSSDAQSGYEIGMSGMAALLGGMDLITMGALLDGLMIFDDATLAVSAEIASMLKRVSRGLEFGEANLALEAIAAAGPGGMFLDALHTLRRMRNATFLPDIADRTSWPQWQANGAQDTRLRALRRVRDILTRDNPAVFTPDVDARIRSAFEDLVNGDALPPSVDATGHAAS
jgi:trimethylamine--corrinoid protein Co-methyltransferase